MIARVGMLSTGHPDGWYALSGYDKCVYLAYEMAVRDPANSIMTCDTSAFVIADMAAAMAGVKSGKQKENTAFNLPRGSDPAQQAFFDALREDK